MLRLQRQLLQKFSSTTRIACSSLVRSSFPLLVCFTLVFLLGCNRSSEPQIGQPAAEFSFVSPNGVKKTLSDFRGKKTLVIFWSTWCDVCRSELDDLSLLHDALVGKVNVIGVIVRDQKQKALEFLSERKVTFENGIADTKPISDKYKVDGVPEVFFVNEKGEFLPLKDLDGSISVKLIGGKPWADPAFYQQLLSQ